MRLTNIIPGKKVKYYNWEEQQWKYGTIEKLYWERDGETYVRDFETDASYLITDPHEHIKEIENERA